MKNTFRTYTYDDKETWGSTWNIQQYMVGTILLVYLIF